MELTLAVACAVVWGLIAWLSHSMLSGHSSPPVSCGEELYRTSRGAYVAVAISGVVVTGVLLAWLVVVGRENSARSWYYFGAIILGSWFCLVAAALRSMRRLQLRVGPDYLELHRGQKVTKVDAKTIRTVWAGGGYFFLRTETRRTPVAIPMMLEHAREIWGHIQRLARDGRSVPGQ
jgi:MFS family permease